MEKGLIGRRSEQSYLSGMALIVSDRLELGIAPEKVVHFFPTVVISFCHFPSLPCDDL